MAFTVRTEGIWTNADFETVRSAIRQEATLWTNQGKTDGINQHIENSPVTGQNTNIRVWDTQQTAEEWIIYIYTLGVPPISYVILPD